MGISYRQLDTWAKAGYLRPVKEPGASQRTWPEIEIRVGRMMSRLIAVGITPAKAAAYARAAVVDRTPMLLEFRDGRLSVRGPFSHEIREYLRRQRKLTGLRKYRSPLDSQEKAC